MRRVLANHHEVAHFFANKVQSEGKASRMFFENMMLFSYGRHFCIAKWVSDDTVAFTTQRYSASTGKHIGIARGALSHVKKVYCHDPAASCDSNRRTAETGIIALLNESRTERRIQQKTRDGLKAQALHHAIEFNEYLAALNERERGNCVPFDTSALDHLRELREQQALATLAKLTEDRAKQAEEARKVLVEWRNGHDVEIHRLRNLPVALRLGNSRGTHNTGGLLPDRGSEGKPVIETSWGAQIPREATLKLWTLVVACKEQDRPLVLNVGVPLGHYRLNKIDANGDIHVGCHHIKYDELVLMAEILGYDIPVTA